MEDAPVSVYKQFARSIAVCAWGTRMQVKHLTDAWQTCCASNALLPFELIILDLNVGTGLVFPLHLPFN